jgi:signal transduction histidine kinase
MTTLMGWVPGFLRTAFEGGPAGQRRVVLMVCVTVGPFSSLVAAVLASGGVYDPHMLVRNITLLIVIGWLVVRKPPTPAEWVIVWTLLMVGWVIAQLAVGPQYSGVYALNGLAVLTLVCLVFDTWLVAYVASVGIAAYAVVQFHFHPVPQALVTTLMFAIVESLLALIVHGTAGFLRDSLRDVGILHGRVVQAADTERARISGELHDDTVQVLTAIGLRMDTLIGRMKSGRIDASVDAARDVRQMVGDATERTRRLSFNLYPPQLDHRGLRPALDALGNELSRGEELTIQISAPARRYPPEVERLAYRTIRELLLNAHRHAAASRVRVSVEPETAAVRCSVRDDGRGFDAREVAAARAEFHTGLDSAATRIRVYGGEFEVTSAPTMGTLASFTIPLDGRSGESGQSLWLTSSTLLPSGSSTNAP